MAAATLLQLRITALQPAEARGLAVVATIAIQDAGAITHATLGHNSPAVAGTPPMLLTDLSEDALALVAARVVRDGEAFWMAILCRATWRAVRAACQSLKLPLVTRASTAFHSLARLHTIVGAERLLRVVHANMNASNVSARPHSLDRKLVWSPAGERVIVASASIEVLDYVWAGWRLSLEPLDPGCFIVRAASAGRVDLLREMNQHAEQQGLDPILNGRTLRARMRSVLGHFDDASFPSAMTQAMQWAESALMEPALLSGNTAAIRWYYSELDSQPASECAVMYGGFRTALSRSGSVVEFEVMKRLAAAATRGADPYASLTFLSSWMWPRLGSRSTLSGSHHLAVVGAVVLTALELTNNEAAQAWQWLQGAMPQGAKKMLHLLATEANLHVAPVMQHIWEVRNVEVYRWFRNRLHPTGWLFELTTATFTLPHVADRSRAMQFAHMTLGAIEKRSADQESSHPEAAWELDRALCVEATADVLIMAWERPTLVQLWQEAPSDDARAGVLSRWREEFNKDTGTHLDWMLDRDVGALVDALVLARPRIAFDSVLSHVRKTYVPNVLEHGSGCTHAMQMRLVEHGW